MIKRQPVLAICGMFTACIFAQSAEGGKGLAEYLQPVVEEQLGIVQGASFALIGTKSRSDYNSKYYYYEYIPEKFYWGNWRDNHYALLMPISSPRKIGQCFVVAGGENSTWKKVIPINEKDLWNAIIFDRRERLFGNRALWEMVLDGKARTAQMAFPIDEVPLRGRARKIEVDHDGSILVLNKILEGSTSVASFEVIERQLKPGELALLVDRIYFGDHEDFSEAENRFLHPQKWKQLIGRRGVLIAGKSIASIDYNVNDDGSRTLDGPKFYPEKSFVSTSLFSDAMLEVSASPFYDVRVEKERVEKQLFEESQKRKHADME